MFMSRLLFLGMKLKTYRRILRPFNRLNNPFGGFCDYLETSRQALDRLMMYRIDDNVGRAEHSRQPRIRIDGYTMVHVAVLNSFCRIFARKVLPQTAAESDVYAAFNDVNSLTLRFFKAFLKISCN